MTKKLTLTFATLSALVLLTACGGSSEQAPEQQAAAGLEMAAAGDLPPGHPPVEAGDAGPMIAPVPPGTGTGAAAITWEVPAGWVEEAPSSSMRRAQYRVPGEAGAGEAVVFYFGPGEGGAPMDNAIRWAGQFAQPDGSSPSDAMSTQEIEVNGMPVLLVEVQGTYSGGMVMMGGADQQLEGHALVGAIAEGPDANWFFKFTGPEATIEQQRDAFLQMIRSLSAGG